MSDSGSSSGSSKGDSKGLLGANSNENNDHAEPQIIKENWFSYVQHNRILALIWRILLVICSISGIPCIFVVSAGFHPETQLYYFTMQTNFFVLFMFVFLVGKSVWQIIKEGPSGTIASIYHPLQLFVVTGITITFLGYVVLLSGMGFTMAGVGVSPAKQSIYAAGNWLVHIIVPFMAIFDWVMFMPHQDVSYKAIIFWMIYPVVYTIILVIRAAAEGTEVFVIATKDGKPVKSMYPYFFMAFEKFPWWQTMLIIIAILVFFILFSLLYVFIDKKLPKVANK